MLGASRAKGRRPPRRLGCPVSTGKDGACQRERARGIVGAVTEPWTRAEIALLAVLGGVIFLDGLDTSLMQVALPSIGSALHLPPAQLQWIVSAYVLGYGGFLLLGGRCADLFGR